jgi:uncharacterized protein (DUF2147 family)
MKRFFYLVVLMALGSSAQAGNSVSFVVAGHRVTIEAPRDCNSPSCVSVSIPGVYETHGGRDRSDDNDDVSDAAVPVKPPAAQQPQVSSIMQPASKPATEPTASAPPPPPAVVGPAATAAADIAAPSPSRIQSASTLPKTPQPKPLPATASLPATATSSAAATPAAPPAPAPHAVQVLQEMDDDPSDAPLGDWQTEGNKGSVRIEACGRALCGYLLNPASNASGETVLINMKPNAASQWSGNIYSRDSGSTYYATIAMKGPDSLRVEACALGQLFCSGNVWSRIGVKPEKLVTSHRASWVPRS